MKNKTAITYGTFDMFHVGHLNLFKKLKTLADKVIVAVSTDEFNEIKGKKSVIPYEQRIEIVQSIKYVDEVIPEYSWNQKIDDIKNNKVDIFAIGNDWSGKFDFLKEYCDVIYLERTQDISTTKLKKALDSIFTVPKDDLVLAINILEKLKNELI